MGDVTKFPEKKRSEIEFIGVITTDDDSLVITDPDDILKVMQFIMDEGIKLYRTEVSNDG